MITINEHIHYDNDTELFYIDASSGPRTDPYSVHTVQELADLISFYHAQKIKKDKKFKKQYENTTNNNSGN